MESDKMLDITEEKRPSKNEKYKRKSRRIFNDELLTTEDIDNIGEQFITKSMEIVQVNLTGLGDTSFGREVGVLDRGKKLLMCQDGAGEQKGRSQMDLNSKSTTSINKAENPGQFILEERKDEQNKVKQSVFTKIKTIANLSSSTSIPSDLELIQSLEECPWRVVYVKKATIAFDTTRMAPTLIQGSIEEENKKERMRFRENRRALRNPRFSEKWSPSHRHLERVKYSRQAKEKRVEQFVSLRNKTKRHLFSPIPPASSPSSLSTDTDTVYDSETSNGKLELTGQSSSSSSDIIEEPGYVVIQGNFRPQSVALSRLGDYRPDASRMDDYRTVASRIDGNCMDSSNNAIDDGFNESKLTKIKLRTCSSPSDLVTKVKKTNRYGAKKWTQEFLIFGLSVRFEGHLGCFSSSSCTFPITGTWVTSDKGTLTFTSTTIPSFPTNYFGPLSFTCDTQSGNKYMAISSSFSHFGTDFEAYICLELTQISTNKYTFYMGSDFNATVGNERIKSAATGAARSFSEVCDRTVYEDGTYSVMIKDGTISSERIDCPSYLQSTWQYSYDDGSGSNACAAGSECDVCSDSQTLQFNYTICSQPIMYSYETNNFRFTCLVITASSDRVYVSQYPQNCQAGQTPTNVSSPGAALVFTQIASGTTTIATTTTTTTENTEVSSASGLGGGGIAAIVIFMLICIAAIAALVMYILWRKYQNKLDNTKPRPDPKYANGEIRNFRRSKHDGVLPEVVVVNENKEIDDETKTPRPTGKVDNVPKLPRLQSTDDVRSSLESAGAISVRRESSIVVSIPTSRSDVDKVSETEEEESATETETEQHDKTESRIEDTILEASEEEEAEVTMNGDVKNKDVVETKKKRKRVRKKKSNVTNRVNPRSPESDRGQSMTPRHGVPLKPGSASKTKASDKIVSTLLIG
ncbi:hypothetical protein FSP39_025177 [Pinctada imbricata]|uniref:Uncharacterized protein n=1 Tax=Pinctada imbricata TaxID=66713 RepID=A0AA89C9E8_PINIB|nr:hypothetical protein FSP39_025177 [Pinctada imbricata]